MAGQLTMSASWKSIWSSRLSTLMHVWIRSLYPMVIVQQTWWLLIFWKYIMLFSWILEAILAKFGTSNWVLSRHDLFLSKDKPQFRTKPLFQKTSVECEVHNFSFDSADKFQMSEKLPKKLCPFKMIIPGMTQLQMFQKVESGWWPIFKVVLEC